MMSHFLSTITARRRSFVLSCLVLKLRFDISLRLTCGTWTVTSLSRQSSSPSCMSFAQLLVTLRSHARMHSWLESRGKYTKKCYEASLGNVTPSDTLLIHVGLLLTTNRFVMAKFANWLRILATVDIGCWVRSFSVSCTHWVTHYICEDYLNFTKRLLGCELLGCENSQIYCIMHYTNYDVLFPYLLRHTLYKNTVH